MGVLLNSLADAAPRYEAQRAPYRTTALAGQAPVLLQPADLALPSELVRSYPED